MRSPMSIGPFLTAVLLLLCSPAMRAQVVGWQLPLAENANEGGTIDLRLERDAASEMDTVFISISGAVGRIAGFQDTVVFANDALAAICAVSVNDNVLCDGPGQVEFNIASTSADSINAARRQFTLTVLDDDSAQAGVASDGLSVCEGGTIPLAADPLAPGWSGLWSVVNGGAGSFSDDDSPTSTFVHTGGIGPVVLRWTITNNGCTDAVDVTVAVVEPQQAEVGLDQTICSGGSTGPLGGVEPPGWSGSWSALANTGDFSDGQLGNTTFVDNGTATGPLTLTWTITDDSAACPNSFDIVSIILVQPPDAIIGTNDTVQLCQGDTLTLNGSAPANGQTGLWSIEGGGSVDWFGDTGSGNSSFRPATFGEFQLFWTITDDLQNCPSSSDSLSVVVHRPPDAGPDTSLVLCEVGGVVDLFGLLLGADMNGVWANDTVDLPNGTYDPATMNGGSYFYRVEGTPPCPTDTASIHVEERPSPPIPEGVFSIDGGTFCQQQYTALSIMAPQDGVDHIWSCEGCLNTDGLDGASVELHWGDQSPPWSYSVAAVIGQCSSDTLTVAVGVGEGLASCPIGIVYFEPHGLAVLDPLADQFQWGSLVDGAFVPNEGATAQTIFDPANIDGCLPYYVVRTRRGNGCWTTTTTCLDETPERACDTSDLVGISEEMRVDVSPNPVQDGAIRFLLSGLVMGEELAVEVYSLEGRLVHQRTYFASPQLTIGNGTEVFPPGLYLLRVTTEGVSRSVKFAIN